MYRFYTYFVKCIPKYFMFFDATINGSVFKFHFSIVHCSIIVQLMFIHWPCIQILWWIQSLLLIMFLVNFLGFSLTMIIWHLIKSSSKSFLLLALLYWLEPISRMLKRSGESGHSCLVSIICGKGFKFSLLKTYFYKGLLPAWGSTLLF